MFRSKELHALFKIYNKVSESERSDRSRPVLASSMQIVLEIMDAIIPYLSENDDCKELFFHLQKPHLQVILLLIWNTSFNIRLLNLYGLFI